MYTSTSRFMHLESFYITWRTKCHLATKLVLANLAFHANKNDLLAFPSFRTIAKETGLNLRTVTRCMKQVKADGIIGTNPAGRHFFIGAASPQIPEVPRGPGIHRKVWASDPPRVGVGSQGVGMGSKSVGIVPTEVAGRQQELKSKAERDCKVRENYPGAAYDPNSNPEYQKLKVSLGIA